MLRDSESAVVQMLQEDLRLLLRWIMTSKMRPNLKKSSVMWFSIMPPSVDPPLEVIPLLSVHQQRYLRVTLDNRLNWSLYIFHASFMGVYGLLFELDYNYCATIDCNHGLHGLQFFVDLINLCFGQCFFRFQTITWWNSLPSALFQDGQLCDSLLTHFLDLTWFLDSVILWIV